MAGMNEIVKEMEKPVGVKIAHNDLKELGDNLLVQILNTVKAGEKVMLRGFGTFEMKVKEGRTGRNPATGEDIEIPTKYVLKFKPAAGIMPEYKVKKAKKK